MIVDVTEAEVWQAVRIGCQRQIENLFARRRDTHALRAFGWTEHIVGAIGELAAARALGIEWTPQTFARRHTHGDITGGHEVRATLHAGGHLILHPSDPDERYYYLVTGQPPTLEVVGWILGRRGKDRQWWDTKRTRAGAFMVPQSALNKLKADQEKTG